MTEDKKESKYHLGKKLEIQMRKELRKAKKLDAMRYGKCKQF